MKSARTLLLVSVAVSVALSFAAASASGSATVLCKAEEEPCEPAQVYEAGTELEASASEVVIKSAMWNSTCQESSIEGETLADAGSPLQLALSVLTLSKCKTGELECTWTVPNLPYYASVEKTSEDKASMSVEGGEGGNPSATMKCGVVSCAFAAETLELEVTGGNPAQLGVSEQVLTKTSGGFLCPISVSWSATYTVDTPKPAHIALDPPGVLCKAAPEKDGKCPAGQLYSGKIVANLPGASTATLTALGLPMGTVTCTEAPMTGDIKASGTGTIDSIKFNKEGNSCDSDFNGAPKVATSLEHLPADKSSFSFFDVGGGYDGLLFIGGSKNMKFKLIPEKSGTECIFRMVSGQLKVRNPEPSIGQPMYVMQRNWVGVRISGNTGVCPIGLTIKGEWWIETAGSEDIWLTKG